MTLRGGEKNGGRGSRAEGEGEGELNAEDVL